ncbi:hypothetical protein ACFQAV_04735 [Companilactobacillus huachuanensis]|uniref:Uncharacterized protein n=1 Tax=Companilactobacillus huachuanensis TaxID=2559914 RepID=A0ABW1RJV9_9LACO|nr:hypothetical protein [Companilactobacillus huachuanensis]
MIKTAEVNKGPQIDVTSPIGSKKYPHIALNDHFDLTGYWSDRKSNKVKSLSYTIDGGEEKVFEKDIENSMLGKLVAWRIDDLDIKKYNDFKKHKLVIKITDDEDMTDTDIFYFKHVSGNTHLVAPEEIDFGRLSVTNAKDKPSKPDLKGDKVVLEDFRKEGSNKLGVSLSIDKFYKDAGDLNGGDDGDDGDDSNSTVDPDRASKEKVSLLHDVYWDDKPVSSKNILVGQTSGPKNKQWQQTTDFTDEIVEKLKIGFRSNEDGQIPGKYISHWTWQTIDSIV